MLRLTIVSGSRSGTSLSFGREPVRVGRSAGAELRFAGAEDAVVSTHHAQIVFERGGYFVVDTGSTNGTLLNGARLAGKRALQSGDRLRFGLPSGPEVEVHVDAGADDVSSASTLGGTVPVSVIGTPVAPSQPARGPLAGHGRAAGAGPSAFRDSELQVADAAARELAERRAEAGGKSSGDTVVILARAMSRATDSARHRTSSLWRKVLLGVGGTALLVIAVLGGVVLHQQREIDRLADAKTRIDGQIQALQERMRVETDPARLAAMEESLATLTGTAETTLLELKSKDGARAAQLAAGGDELDREIRQILAKFNASTYAVPPIFRERLQFHIDALSAAGDRGVIFGRRQQHWPMILREFSALGLPEEMAYIAWVESGFDPQAQSPAGAAGLWQMTTTTAQSLGLTVGGGVDERLQPERQTRAAATYLARLLSEFGEDSFMLALASYNRGENGVRRALRQVAQEPGGFRKDKRDFWHLYRLKLLPEETREYVPRVLAAAIVARRSSRSGTGAEQR